MRNRVEALVEEARALSPEEQALLAEALYEMVNPPDPEWEAAWVKECEDRIAAYDRGEMKAHDSEEVMARPRGKYGLK